MSAAAAAGVGHCVAATPPFTLPPAGRSPGAGPATADSRARWLGWGRWCRAARSDLGHAGGPAPGVWARGVGRGRYWSGGCDGLVAGDVGGAAVVAQELVAVRGGPQVGAGFQDGVAPAGVVGLEPVVAPAQRGQVVTAVGAALGCRGSRGPVSQASAGRVHHGNTQVRSRSAAWAASRSGTSYWSTCRCSARSTTGFTVTVVPGTPHQVRTWSASTKRAGVRHPGQVQPVSGCRDRLVGQVHVQHHLAARSRGRSLGLGGGVEVQGQLVAGHLPEGFGAAHVQRRGRAEVGEPGGAGREGGVEVQGVGQVDLGLAPTRCPRRTPDRCARGRAGRPRRPPGGAGPRRA